MIWHELTSVDNKYKTNKNKSLGNCINWIVGDFITFQASGTCVV